MFATYTDILQTALRLCLISLGLVCVNCLCVCIYRLTLHPFAKYPGPFLAKITDLYALYHACKRDGHVDVWRCHEKYGNVVRYSPSRLVINSKEGVHEIYGHGKNVKKGRYYHRSPLYHNAFNTHNTLDKKAHGRKKRVLGSGFSDSAMRAQAELVLEHVERFCARLMEKDENLEVVVGTVKPPVAEIATWTEPKNLTVWIGFLTFDVISHLSFGKAFGMLSRPDMRDIRKSLSAFVMGQQLAGQSPELFSKNPGSWYNLRNWLIPGYTKSRLRFESVGRRMAMERTEMARNKEDEEKRGDIMHNVLKAKDPETGEGFTDPELWAEANLLIGAGADTTSTAITSVLFYLSRKCNSHAYAKLAEEIRSTFDSVDHVKPGPELSSCSYLRACLDEALRMSPSVPGVLYREAQIGGATVDGTYIPAGYEVGTGTFSVQHREEYYPEPFAFRPERWIASDDNPESAVKVAQSAFIPFSVGPRMCLGKNLAYMEMTVVLARIIWLADFRSVESTDGKTGGGKPGAEYGRHRVDEFQLNDQFTAETEGPLLQFKRRDIG